MILDFVKFINTTMAIFTKQKFQEVPIDWYDKDVEFKFRDIPLNWMSNVNSHCWREEHEAVNNTLPFFEYSTDTIEAFRKIKPVMPKYWRWHTDTIGYRYNTQGFRNNVDFDKVDWKNSYVVFGCSMITGVGQPLDGTIVEYLRLKLDEPVINMGSAGGSSEVVFNNFIKMITDYGVPKGCIFLWPEPSRQLDDLHYVTHSHYENDWRRIDIHPTIAKVKHINDGKPFYRRNLFRHTIRAMIKGTYISEIVNPEFIIAPGKVPISVPKESKQLVLYPDFPEFLNNDLKRTNGHLPQDWPSVSTKSKEWYLNNWCARDIGTYSEENGPAGSHMGPFVNKAIADCLFDRLAKV